MVHPRRVKTRAEIAERLLDWYSKGELGLVKVCHKARAHQEIPREVRHWFNQGARVLDSIVKDLMAGEESEESEKTGL